MLDGDKLFDFKIRMSTGRTKAFLLFLAGLPLIDNARQRRQEWLGMDDARAVPSLLAGVSGEKPGNHVIASPGELRNLRAAIKKGRIDAPMADEFGIPLEALDTLPDEGAFLETRNQWLVLREREFIESFGLMVSDSE